MIDVIEKNLKRGIQLLSYVSDKEYRNTTIAPYYSSIGGHMRHVLDVFDCVFEGVNSGSVNLINRERDQLIENFTEKGINYFEETIEKLQQFEKTGDVSIQACADDLGAVCIALSCFVCCFVPKLS